MNQKKRKEYIKEIIREDYKEWNDENIIISSGTNTGKTTFIINILIPYALEKDKSVLYLVNRKYLNDALKERIAEYPNATLKTYQSIEEMIRRDKVIEHYDYIIVDECHYFHIDCIYNNFTDLSLNWLMNQQNNVIVWMSATARIMFSQLHISGKVKPERTYSIKQDYTHIDAISFYKRDQIKNIINDILENTEDEKILVFVNAIDRLKEMFSIYGNKASYLCSKTRKNDGALSFVDFGCIKQNTFEKRILFVTKALDNGIDLKDSKIKHIFSEIIDVDSALQSIGRKRPVADDDNYNLYFRSYGNRALTQYCRTMQDQLAPVEQYTKDRKTFLIAHRYDREFFGKSRVMYVDFSDMQPKIRINNNVRKKFYSDMCIYQRMLEKGYEDTLLRFFESDVTQKVKPLKIEKDKTDLFLEYLQEILNKKLFKTEQKELKAKFNEVGLHDRSMGINTLNGKLKDCGYPFTIISAQETKGENRKKRYWRVVPVDGIQTAM